MPAVLRLSRTAAPLLEDALEPFLVECRLRGLSPRTVNWYAVTVGPFLRYARSVGCERTDEVDEATVRAFIAEQQTKVSPRRVNDYRDGLRAFFEWAVREGHAALNPAARLRKLREPRKIIATLSEADLEALLAQPDPRTFVGLRDLTFMLLLLDTGVRVSEATGLRLDDLDFSNLTLKVMGKGSKERLVASSPAFAARLQSYLTRRAAVLKVAGLRENPWLFVSQFGTQATPRAFQDQLKVYAQRAGIVGVRVSPHTFRHTFAVFFVRHGGSPFHLQKCLGHTDLTMSRRYCELADVDFLTKQRELSLVGTLNLDPGRRPRLRQCGSVCAAQGAAPTPSKRAG